MDKFALITGAYGGMGKAAVELFKSQGYTVFALDKRVENAVDGIIPIECDVTDELSVQHSIKKVAAVTDRLNAVVHYAGIYMLDSLVEMPAADFQKNFAINLFGVYLVNKAAVQLLTSGSKIVIVTSELAPLDPLPFTGIYAVSKGALDKYAYALRMELQLLGISVSVIRAGAVKTNMLGASVSALDRFCEKTQLYKCNAENFRKIVDSVEAKSVPPQKIAQKTIKIVSKKSPKFAYSVNRNPLLKLLAALPVDMQTRIIKRILK